jgi:hypothetical protein
MADLSNHRDLLSKGSSKPNKCFRRVFTTRTDLRISDRTAFGKLLRRQQYHQPGIDAALVFDTGQGNGAIMSLIRH